MRLRAWLTAYPAQAAVLLLALLAVCFFGFALVSWQAARQSHAAVLHEQRTQQAHVQHAAERARLEAVIAPYSEHLDRLQGKLDSELKEGALLSAFQSLAQSSNARLVNFRMEDRPPQGEFRVRVAYIELQGAYASVRRFMSRVEQLPVPALVGNAILEKDPTADRYVKATLEVITFVQGGTHAAR